jgi:hypothetical protein
LAKSSFKEGGELMFKLDMTKDLQENIHIIQLKKQIQILQQENLELRFKRKFSFEDSKIDLLILSFLRKYSICTKQSIISLINYQCNLPKTVIKKKLREFRKAQEVVGHKLTLLGRKRLSQLERLCKYRQVF